MKLRYTLQAAAELDELLTFVEQRSPRGAHRIQMRIQEVIALLQQYPNAGQPTNSALLRRITIPPYPYLIFYRIGDGEIIVHGVRHGARHPQSMPAL